MTSDAADGSIYSLLDNSRADKAARPDSRDDWEQSALLRVAQHVRELAGERADAPARRGWESQAVERLARYLRTARNGFTPGSG